MERLQLKTVVIGGWGINPLILKKTFGNDAVYLDGTRTAFEYQGSLSDPQKFFDSHKTELTECNTLAGWSLGAMIATLIAPIVSPQKMILFSPTLSFCRTDTWRHGTRKHIVEQMREAIYSSEQTVLKNFADNSGVTHDWIADHPNELLCDGLRFLESIELTVHSLDKTAIDIHLGKSDKIIPPEASRIFAQNFRATLHEHDGGHAFFLSTEILI